MSDTTVNLSELPHCWDYVYVWDGPDGYRRSFTPSLYNGRKFDRWEMVFTADQMSSYATAAVLADREARHE